MHFQSYVTEEEAPGDSLSMLAEYDFTGPLDVVFAVDASVSIGPNDFADSLTFVRQLITTSINVHPDYTRIALVTFAAETQVTT